MNYIENLLQGQKVEWKTLGELVETITAPLKVKKEKYQVIGKIPIIDQGEKFIAGYIDEGEFLEESEYIIFGDHSEHIKYVDFAFVQGADGLKILKAKKDFSKYLYYAFQNFYRKEGNYKRHWSSAKDTEIPLPPLAVQQEIANILDKFTALEAELEAELDCRKRQYHHYRDTLLTFGDNVEWKTLGEVGDVTKLAGFEFTNYIKYSEKGNVIALRGLNIKGNLDLSDVKYIDESDFSKLERSKLIVDDMLFTYVGTIGNVVLIPENDKYYLAPNVARIRFKDRKILPKFMFYYFQTDTFISKQINKYLGKSSMKNLTMENIRKFQIPLPPLEEQKRIAEILDKFDTLTNSITEGLPKEIELRRKQYEYYREQLLMFNYQ